MSNKRGLTLIEILVTMSIFMLIFILGGNFIITGFKGFSFTNEQQTAIQSARKAMNNISVDVREAAPSDRGDYALSSIGPHEFTWYGDIYNNDAKEKIRYFLSADNILFREVTEPGVDNDYSAAPVTSIIARHINNQGEPVFRYFDGYNNETATINAVRLVKVILKINVTPGVAPNDYYVETDIQLRNLKDNL